MRKLQQHLVRGRQEKVIYLKRSGRYLVRLVGKGSGVKILGRFMVVKKKLEIEVEIRHEAEETSAKTDIRGAVRSGGKLVVKGIIKVVKGAQKTDSMLVEKALLLDKNAQAELVPELEIEANDVKASHAATVSKIDEEQIFYLMSRGLRRRAARELIISGFLKM